MADKKESSLGSEIKDWVISIAIAVVLALFIRHFVVELYLVDGPSMRPTLQNQERLVVNKFIYNLHDPERGDILVFQYPKDPSRDFIKRVIAIPGDTTEAVISGIIADEMAIGMINSKTTAVRLIPVPNKKAGERVVFGGLLGEADIININNLDCSVLINRGGRVAPPIQALKN